MADNIHDLSTDSYRTLNLNCHEKDISVCYPLTKSSSYMICGTLSGSRTKPEIHKSLNTILTVTKCDENSFHSSHNRSPTENAQAAQFPINSNGDHLSVDKVEEKVQLKNHYLSADSSLAATKPEIIQNFVRYNVSENISLLGRSEMSVYDAESVEMLDTPPLVVQKSYSDYCCSHRTSVPHSVSMHNKNSATYSNLSSSSSMSGSGSDRTCNLSTVTQDSGIVYSPSNVQNNLADAIFTDIERNIPLCHMNGSSIQHDITVYAVPGTYHHGILGSRHSGLCLSNNEHVYSQSQYSLTHCVNISESKLSLPPLNFHSSCSTHCCKVCEPTVRVDDTIAAYCHSMPIPSAQLSTRLGHSTAEPGLLHTQLCSQVTLSHKLAYPKLVSSVSESGLDAKKLMKSGQLTFPQPPNSDEGSDLNISVKENNDFLLKTVDSLQKGLEPSDMGTKTRDNWTMTSFNYLSSENTCLPRCKDVEVQTVIIMENKSVATVPCLQATGNSLLYPQLGSMFSLQCPQTPVRQVRWDDEGMTWEVYGAAVDPEILGLAIQKHLDIQIEQHVQPSEASGETDPSAKGKRRSFRTVIQSLRQSNCCVRTSSTSD